ncbi:MAG: hypothetical protein SAL07_22955 [Oscillatoria sp. PMC 1051.18]|nr:hypothetical protein [Oscillatoria sp. PMC 1050.18]MEC5032771.1 hypothetical protein [Oscillatoria sp. PMC 1051.18]
MENMLIKVAISIKNNGCDDLELLKIYQVLPDESAAKNNYLRVIDESGEDYLYPESNFTVINLSPSQEKILFPLLKKDKNNL